MTDQLLAPPNHLEFHPVMPGGRYWEDNRWVDAEGRSLHPDDRRADLEQKKAALEAQIAALQSTFGVPESEQSATVYKPSEDTSPLETRTYDALLATAASYGEPVKRNVTSKEEAITLIQKHQSE